MEKQPNSRFCFVCGMENHLGLKLELYNDNELQRVIGKVIVPGSYNSYPGIVHGGIVSALLDETSSRALMLNGNFDSVMATAKLEVKFHCATPCDEPITVIGWLVEELERSTIVAGEIRLEDGTLTASSIAVLKKLPPSFREVWEEEKKYLRVYED